MKPTPEQIRAALAAIKRNGCAIGHTPAAVKAAMKLAKQQEGKR
jgi:hypothetical protein